MPQFDRHWGRGLIPIEFEPHEHFAALPMMDRVTLVLVSNGNAVFELNGKAVAVAAPCMLLISQYDHLKLTESTSRFTAKSFSFSPVFVNSSLTFERLNADDFRAPEDAHDRNMIRLFLDRDEFYDGMIDLPPQTYLRISEWLSIIGTETFAQSNGSWTCRIRRYLLQTLYLLEDIYRNRQIPNQVKREKSPVDILLEYIHTNYPMEITLNSLCNLAHLNRTSLNRKFKTQTGSTPMDYVLMHRLKIACDELAHTKLTLVEIAEAIGFKHDTYFIKQFTAKIGESPTEYRRKAWEIKELKKQELSM